MYALLRAIAGVALRWYYRDIQIEGLERVPRRQPVLLVVNHPNALVDALLVGWIMPRRVLITAKSTIFANPVAAALLRWLGVLPLYRASDVATPGQAVDPARNRDTFRAVREALARGGAVLIFPEGKSHDEPAMVPLKTGAARMALQAWQSASATNLAILPIGLTFERKDAPRSRVLVQIGEPIHSADWKSETNADANIAEALTAEIDARLRAVTMNYATIDDAMRAVRLSSMIAALFEEVPPIGVVDRRLASETTIARRIGELGALLPRADNALRAQADQLIRRLDSTQHVAAKHGVLIEDIRISLEHQRAATFVVREAWIVLVAGPIALWGRINHWLPFRAARLVAMRSVDSAADPAMRTLVAGAAFVLLTYLAQTAVVWKFWGPMIAGIYLLSLPLAADINFLLSDRLRRAARRARAYFLFRRDPLLQERLAAELETLRRDVIAFDRALGEREVGAPA